MFHSDMDRSKNAREFHGIYRGEVIDVMDPYKAGRIRVRVFGVHDDYTKEAVPWAIMADALMGGDSNRGGFFVPDMKSHVFVFFENGDPTQPVYVAGAPARRDGPTERNTDYPHNRVYKTSTGHVIEINNGESNYIKLTHNSGTTTVINSDGSVNIDTVGDVTTNVSGDYSLTATGNVSIAGTRIDLN